MFARFDENPAMTLQDIKKKRYGRMDAHTDNVKTVYPPQTKFAGGIINLLVLAYTSADFIICSSLGVAYVNKSTCTYIFMLRFHL